MGPFFWLHLNFAQISNADLSSVEELFFLFGFVPGPVISLNGPDFRQLCNCNFRQVESPVHKLLLLVENKKAKGYGTLFCKLMVSGRVEIASATETRDLGSILARAKPNTHSFFARPSAIKRNSVKTVCGRQVGRWQLDSKTERSLRRVLSKAIW